MITITEKNGCTGCTACMNRCPQDAIIMKVGTDGFLYPEINSLKCINCGLCKRVCPVNSLKVNKAINRCYVGYAKDENIRFYSSSGGIFTVLSNYILDNNGIVIGASFDKEHKLRHIAITTKEELEKLRGSKYLQSDLGNIFKFVKNNIQTKKVLFVGTPCQTAGLKAYLENDYENLFCIDLICHGSPSPMLFDKYIMELERKNGRLLKYDFRDNSTGWDSYSNTMVYNDKIISEKYTDNVYMKLFLSDIALRQSCYNCQFKLGNKYSDITLGDFWGIKNYYPEMYNEKGVSCIIINTVKGEQIFENINKELEFKTCELNEIVNSNYSLSKSSKLPKKRERFFHDINKLSMRKLASRYTQKSFIRKLLRKLKKVVKNLIIYKKDLD